MLFALYLDFDGVMHSPNVFQSAGKGAVFEHLPILAAILAPHPAVKIVLSTSWAKQWGLEVTTRRLGLLGDRVVGSTFHGRFVHPGDFDLMPRGMQVWRDVEYRQPDRWVALDDDSDGWPEFCRDHLVCCDPDRGLRCPATQEHLRSKLRSFG